MAMASCLPFNVASWCIDWAPPLLLEAILDASTEVPSLGFCELWKYLNLKFGGLSGSIKFNYTKPQPTMTHQHPPPLVKQENFQEPTKF